jgi:hypothetical protein
MHWDLKRDTFCAIVGAIHFLFFLGTFPELLGYILNGYVENMAKLTVCILSGLGFCALATAMSAVQSLELQVRKDRVSTSTIAILLIFWLKFYIQGVGWHSFL